MSNVRISRKWWRAAEIYRLFVDPQAGYDFSEEAARELFLFESRGEGIVSQRNGYAAGKKWMDVTVGMWLHDIAATEPILQVRELYDDGKFPAWWLDSILGEQHRPT